MISKAEFRNLMAAMRFIEKHELGNPSWWSYFQNDPHNYFIRASDHNSDLIWNVLMKKEPQR